MKEFLNDDTLFATIAMSAQPGGPLVLVVEGDDDWLVLKDHCSQDLRLVAGIGGRENVLRVAELVKTRNIIGVRFLVDKDYDMLTGFQLSRPENVWTSDRHDVFMDLIVNEFERLMRVVEVHAAQAVRRAGANQVDGLQSAVVVEEATKIARLMGLARAACQKCGIAIDFTRIRIGALTSDQLNIVSIVELALIRSRVRLDSADAIIEAFNELESSHRESVDAIVGDHDLFSALARTLREAGAKVSDKTLQKAFLAATTCKGLISTSWFIKVQRWCESNHRKGFNCDATVSAAA